MHTLATLADQSDAPLWGWTGWLTFLLVLGLIRLAYSVGKIVGSDEMRRSMLRHPAVRARHADKRIRQAA